MRAFWRGWKKLRFPAERRTEVFDTALRSGIPLWGERESGGFVEVRAEISDADSLAETLRERGIEAGLSESRGLPALLRLLRNRPGLAVGAVLTAVWMTAASGLVWDVRIEGNESVPDEAVLAQLEELGFGIGTRYRNIDFDRLQTDYLAAQNELAWLSVYMDGTVARVQVWEMRGKPPRKIPDGVYANVTAAEDGVVEEVRVLEGQAAVRPGDVIRAGEIAISGAVEKKDGGVRFEYAEGEVLATTAKVLTAEVPLSRTVYRPTGREKRGFVLRIFKKTVKLFGNSGFDSGTCDTIDTIGKVCLFGRISLPVWIGTEVIRETVPETETVPREEAEAEAIAVLNRMIREACAEGELAGKQIRAEFTGTVCRAEAVLYLTKDVGRTVEFTAEPAG